MSEANQTENGTPPPNEISAGASFNYSDPWNVAFWLLVAFILFTHLFNLGLKPVQHDESMFAYYSWLIYEMPDNPSPFGLTFWREFISGYEFNALLHGPLLEWVTATVFFLFGDSDATMRLAPSLCGVAVMLTLYCLRKRMGLWPAYLAIIFLAISPTFTYVARYIRPDFLVIYLYMGIIHAGWRYADKPTGLRLIVFLLLCWISSMTHETYVIFLFFAATFGVGNLIHALVKGRRLSETAFCRETIIAFRRHWWAILIGNSLGFFLTAAFHTSFFWYHQRSTDWCKHGGHFLGQIESFNFWAHENEGHRIWGPFHFHLVHLALYELPFLIFFTVCIVKQLWAVEPGPKRARRRWLFAAWIVTSYLILMTPGSAIIKLLPGAWLKPAGDTNLNGILAEKASRWAPRLQIPNRDDLLWNWSLGDKGSWMDHHWHMTMGFHVWLFIECLIVVFIVGWIHLNRGKVFHALCDYWTVGSFLAYSYAGEKVPWVGAHIVLPMMISCGFYAADIVKKYFPGLYCDRLGIPEPKAVAPIPVAAAAEKKDKKGSKAKATPQQAQGPSDGLTIPQHLWMATSAVTLVWTLYVGYILCFRQPGSPMERHTYASSHTQFHQTLQYIFRESAEKYQGLDTPIAFGGQAGWPLNWNLRNYVNKKDLATNETTRTYDNPSRIMINLRKGGTAEAQWVIIDSDMMNAWPTKPNFRGRYEWGMSRFRHYWQPAPLNWQTMKKIGLLLRSDLTLTPEQVTQKNICKKEWKKFLVAYFIRDEELTRNGGPYEWRSMDGFECYFGKLLPNPPAIQMGAIPSAAVPVAPLPPVIQAGGVPAPASMAGQPPQIQISIPQAPLAAQPAGSAPGQASGDAPMAIPPGGANLQPPAEPQAPAPASPPGDAPPPAVVNP